MPQKVGERLRCQKNGGKRGYAVKSGREVARSKVGRDAILQKDAIQLPHSAMRLAMQGRSCRKKTYCSVVLNDLGPKALLRSCGEVLNFVF